MNWNTVLDNYKIYNDILVTLVTISIITTTGEYYYLKLYIHYGIKQVMKMIVTTTITIDFINNKIDDKSIRIN